MFESRVQMRAVLLQSILPPVVFIFIALGALGLMNALFAPMVRLIWDLSSGGAQGRSNSPLFVVAAHDEMRSPVVYRRNVSRLAGYVDDRLAARHSISKSVG